MDQAGLSAPAELNSTHILDLGMPEQHAERIKSLLSRGDVLSAELEAMGNRGQWVLGLTDQEYPQKLLRHLPKESLPPVLFGTGEKEHIQNGCLGVVGSRDVDSHGATYAQQLGVAAGRMEKIVVSGLARGVDYISMHSCMASGGKAVGVLPGNMNRALLKSDIRWHVSNGHLTLLSAVHPDAPFASWQALARNKLIYCLAEFSVVVAAANGRGGTWSGATEALKHRWTPIFVRITDTAPDGNHALLQQGALALGNIHDGIVTDLLTRAAVSNPQEAQKRPEQLPCPLVQYRN